MEDFESLHKYFPILFIFGDLGYLRPVILLSNGYDFCPYIENFRCSIYENRPNICKAYPLSTNIDNLLYHDTSCPGITSKGFSLVNDKKISQHFYSPIFEDYQTKFIKTFYEFETFNEKENFDLVANIKGTKLFKYNKESKNRYMKLHLKSLNNLTKYKIV